MLLKCKLNHVMLCLKVLRAFTCCLVPKSCMTLCDPMDCSLPGSSDHGNLQARILEYSSRLPFPPSGDLPNPGSNLCLISPTLVGRVVFFFVVVVVYHSQQESWNFQNKAETFLSMR